MGHLQLWILCTFFVSLAAVHYVAAQCPARLYNNCTNRFRAEEGVVQVYVNDTWNFINGSDWDYCDAMVACKQLGYKSVSSFYSSDTTVTMPSRSRREPNIANLLPMIMKGIECLGDEKNMMECIMEIAVPLLSILGDNFRATPPGENVTVPNVACVSCAGFDTVRLTGGNAENEGRVEVFYNGSWGTVCDDEWGKEDADVVCRQLGYPGARDAVGGAQFGEGSDKIWLDDTCCTGNETCLEVCSKRQWGQHDCNHDEDAGVICETFGLHSCSVLPQIAQGSASTNSIKIGTEVRYRCDSNFVLIGNEKITCLSTGQWNGSPPLCILPTMGQPTSCPKLPDVAQGGISNTSTAIGTEVTFRCRGGFMMVGHDHITCTKMGVWNGMPPVCLRDQLNSCPPLPDVAHGYASTTSSTEIGTVVSYECEPEFTLIGLETITCIGMGRWGQWNGQPPYCIPSTPAEKPMFGAPPSPASEDDGGEQISHTSAPKSQMSVAGAVVLTLVCTILAIAVILIIIGVVHRHYTQKRKNQDNETLNDLSAPLVTKEEGV